MELMISEDLQSKKYRCLFEYIEKEGVEPALNLIKDIKDLPSKEWLIHQTIKGDENALITLSKKHKDIIKYLKEYKEDFSALFLERDIIQNIL